MRVGLGYQQVLITFYNNLLLLLPLPPDDNDKSCKVAVGQCAPFGTARGSSAPPARARPTPPRPPKKTDRPRPLEALGCTADLGSSHKHARLQSHA